MMVAAGEPKPGMLKACPLRREPWSRCMPCHCGLDAAILAAVPARLSAVVEAQSLRLRQVISSKGLQCSSLYESPNASQALLCHVTRGTTMWGLRQH